MLLKMYLIGRGIAIDQELVFVTLTHYANAKKWINYKL